MSTVTLADFTQVDVFSSNLKTVKRCVSVLYITEKEKVLVVIVSDFGYQTHPNFRDARHGDCVSEIPEWERGVTSSAGVGVEWLGF